MELKNKYQYTYFIYPYIINEKKYDKYLLGLLKNNKCSMRFFEREKDLEIYQHFLPFMKKYMFANFQYNKERQSKLKEFNLDMQSSILAQNDCNVFEYELGNNIQGKTDTENGIFFKIQKIEVICFKTGICFISIKTNIESSNKFEDVLNFNYKFRDINSDLTNLKEYENIKIQTNDLEDVKKISEVIKDITGKNIEKDLLDININRFFTYSYVCLEQEYWNEQSDFGNIENEFLKFVNILPSNYNSVFDKKYIDSNFNVFSKWGYIKNGFNKFGSTLISSGIDTYNYTKLPYIYENEYLYTYIFTLYQKIYLKKLLVEFKDTKNAKKVRKDFMNFTKNVWIQEITTDSTGTKIYNMWKEILEINEIYNDMKNKYNILYKELNIEKETKTNKIVSILLVISLLFNIIIFAKII